MKLFGLFFTFLATKNLCGAILVSKHVSCLELVENSDYNGTRCTVTNISLPETDYNWGGVNHAELHFSNSVVPFLPDRLVEMMEQFVVLNMTNVTLNRLKPNDMSKAKNLKELYLSGNKLTTLANNTFNASENLETLDLSWNEMETIELEAFKNMKSLKKLDLSYNRLVAIGTEFQYLMNLEKLDLSFNDIFGLHLNAIGSLTNINEVHLEDNYVQSLRLNLCNEFNLQLFLSNNSMESISLTWNPMSRMGQENTLEIFAPNNKIMKLSTDREINLINVDLQENGLSSIKGMKNMKQLTTLNLASNKISEVDFDMLRNLTNLQVLNVSFNALKSLDVTNITQKVPNLKFLGIRANFWESCEYLEDIVTVLKKAGIAFDMTEGEGELSCMLIETEEVTEKETETTKAEVDEPKSTTEEPKSTTVKEEKEKKGKKEDILEFINSNFMRILLSGMVIMIIIAVIVRICVDVNRRGVDLSSASYANGNTHV